MKTFSKSKLYIICLLLTAAFSCKDKDPKPDCGCDGPDMMVIENVRGSYTGNNGLLLRLTSDDRIYESYVNACSISDTLKVTPDVKNPDYIVSGKIKKECFVGPTLVAVPPKFQITSIKKGL